jgi:signal transduction histidine kinase
MSKPAIICVDDEPTVLESLKIELKQVLGDSCLIETAESGEEALELLEELQTAEYEIALVFADQIMPGMRGDQLLEQVHLLSPQTLNIMITGHADTETLSQVLRIAKLHRHISKPWQSDDLRTTVLNAIQSYRRDRDLEAENANLHETIRHLEQAVDALRQSEQQFYQQSRQQAALSRMYLAFAIQQFQDSQAMQNQVQQLERLNQLKDDFLNSISNELRSPVSNIRMATQMLEVRLQQLDIYDMMLQCDRYLQILRTECQKEADLINDLLALMRLDSDSDPLSLSQIHLHQWLPHIVEPFIERSQAREQHLHIEIPAAVPAMTTDPSHLERTLIELLNNAWKYTPAGETITVVVELISAANASSAENRNQAAQLERFPLVLPAMASLANSLSNSEVWISVINSGIEIPTEEHERIFDQFYRLPNHGFWSQGGSGLGLTIVKKRVEKLRGSVSMSSQNGQTAFTIKLPLELNIATFE